MDDERLPNGSPVSPEPLEPLSKRIAAYAEQKRRPAHLNRAQYLAQQDQIREALEAGWSAKVIWETLRSEGRLSCSYETFMRLMRGPRSARKSAYRP